jgi:hypothetical protein
MTISCADFSPSRHSSSGRRENSEGWVDVGSQKRQNVLFCQRKRKVSTTINKK